MPVNTTHPDYDSSPQTGPAPARCWLARTPSKPPARPSCLRSNPRPTQEYAAYVQRASFFNATARTAESYLGLIFRRPPCQGRDASTVPLFRSSTLNPQPST